MGLDRFTLIAQIINFLVLVWLLKHFLYGRIVQAMDERAARIAGQLQEAARTRAMAEQEAESYRSRNRQLDEQREQLLAQARTEADAHRQALLEDARLEAETAQRQWLETLGRERRELLEDFRLRLGREVLTLAGRGLEQLADAQLEAQILVRFREQLRGLDPAQREAILAPALGARAEIEVRTAFALSTAAREELCRCLHEQLGDGLRLHFSTVPELICGIELRTGSYRLAWHLASYLEGIEARVFEALDESAREHAPTG